MSFDAPTEEEHEAEPVDEVATETETRSEPDQ
jgi:hypothetical protein